MHQKHVLARRGTSANNQGQKLFGRSASKQASSVSAQPQQVCPQDLNLNLNVDWSASHRHNTVSNSDQINSISGSARIARTVPHSTHCDFLSLSHCVVSHSLNIVIAIAMCICGLGALHVLSRSVCCPLCGARHTKIAKRSSPRRWTRCV